MNWFHATSLIFPVKYAKYTSIALDEWKAQSMHDKILTDMEMMVTLEP